jgi:hypothetical protein
VPDLLDRIERELRQRLEATRAAKHEHDRLEAALRALDGASSGSAASMASGRAARSAQGSRRRRASRARARRAPRGQNRERVLAAVRERPGATTAELAAVSGVERNTLYALLRTLVSRGELERHELPGRGAGYALTTSQGRDASTVAAPDPTEESPKNEPVDTAVRGSAGASSSGAG